MPTLAELAGYGDDPSTTGGGLLGLLTSFIDNRKRGLLNNVQGGPGLLGARINESARDFNREERSWMGAERSVIPELRDMAGQRTLNQTLNMGGLLGLHTVYHGSPYKFDKFDASKIGTGEGAQAYGHGLYFAESPDVAKSYASMGDAYMKIDGTPYKATTTASDAGPGNYAAAALSRFPNDKKAALEWLGDAAPKEAKAMVRRAKSVEVAGGATYKVDVPDEAIGKMLDWDKPLSQQPESVRKALNSAVKKMESWEDEGVGFALQPRNFKYNTDEPTGETIYSALSEWLGNKADPAAALRKLGIPGIRYLDGGSRTGGKGTSNFVLFDDKLPKIVGVE
jgi:hypothetical protein